MSPRKLPDWLRGYMDYTTNTECPSGFNFWVGVWTIAGALRRKVWIDMGHFQWHPNFYLFLVAPPGVVSKSTTLSIGVRLLEQVEGIHFGPEAMTWQALTEALAGAHEEVAMTGTNPMDSVFVPMSCLSISAGELGTLISPHNREMMDALTSLWDGKSGAWEKWTKTSGSDKIINPWLNIASCTTPAWIAQNFPVDLVGGGFTSRCIFLFADKKRQLLAYPGLATKELNKELEPVLLHDLRRIAALKGEYKLTKGAYEWGTAWYERHYRNPPVDIDRERFGGYLARKQTHFHKLAIVLAASASDDLIITETHLRAAEGIVSSTEAQLQRVFESIGVEGAGRHVYMLRKRLEVEPNMTRSKLWGEYMQRMSLDEFEAALVALAKGNIISVTSNGSDVYIKLIKFQKDIPDAMPHEAAR